MNENEKLNLCFLDIETTGLSPEKHSITEIAVIKVEVKTGDDWKSSWKIVEKLELKVLPEHPYVEPFIANLNGYDTQKWMETAVRLPDALTKTYQILQGSIILGSNPAFDKSFLLKGFNALGWNFPKLKSHHMIDVPSLGSLMLLEGQVSSVRQANIGNFFGVPNDGAHRAMNDVKQCMKLFYKFVSSTYFKD